MNHFKNSAILPSARRRSAVSLGLRLPLFAFVAFALLGCVKPIVVAPLHAVPSDEGSDAVRAVYPAIARQIVKTYDLDLAFVISRDSTWSDVQRFDATSGRWVDPPLNTPRRRSIKIAFGGKLRKGNQCGWAIGSVVQTNQGGASWGDPEFMGGGYLVRKEVPGFQPSNRDPDGVEALPTGDVLPFDCAALPPPPPSVVEQPPVSRAKQAPATVYGRAGRR